MRIDIITLFPEMFEPVLGDSIIGRAQKSGAVEIHTHQLRDFAFDKHRRVDDSPYGGGMGMLMKAEPIALCAAGPNSLSAAPARAEYGRKHNDSLRSLRGC